MSQENIDPKLNSRPMHIDDHVIARFVQIFQEAMLAGHDAVDFFRQVELQFDEGKQRLVLTPRYEQQVNDNHEEMLRFISEVQLDKSSEPQGE